MKTQTKLAPVNLDVRWPKNHRQQFNKKYFQKDYPINSKDFEGIIKESEQLGIDTYIVGYSGGRDSGYVLHKLIDMGKNVIVLHLKTNTGVQITEDFVINECKKSGVPLFIREPTPLSFAYVAFCMQFGFPSVRMHSAIMKIIKYNTMKKFIQEPRFKGKHPAIFGGVRKNESVRRFGSYNSPVTQETDLWFVNPLFYKSDSDVYKYFMENGLKRSPAYDTLGFSGECMCGCFAQKDEAKSLEKVDPVRFEFLEWLTDGIKRFGSKEAKKYTKWGERSDIDTVRDQQILELFFNENEINNIDGMALNACGVDFGAGNMKGME